MLKRAWLNARKRARKWKRIAGRRYRRWRAANKPNWYGRPPLKGRRMRKAVVRANRLGLVVTSTTGGTHSPTSWHYKGRAVDVAGAYGAMVQFQREIGKNRAGILELFGPDAFYVKNGARYSGRFPDHGDHVHFAC